MFRWSAIWWLRNMISPSAPARSRGVPGAGGCENDVPTALLGPGLWSIPDINALVVKRIKIALFCKSIFWRSCDMMSTSAHVWIQLAFCRGSKIGIPAPCRGWVVVWTLPITSPAGIDQDPGPSAAPGTPFLHPWPRQNLLCLQSCQGHPRQDAGAEAQIIIVRPPKHYASRFTKWRNFDSRDHWNINTSFCFMIRVMLAKA